MITAVTSGVYHKWFAELPPEVRQQLRLCDQLWDDLLASHQQLEVDRAAIWSSFPTVAAVEARLTEIETTVEQLLEEVAQLKIVQRTKRPNGPAVGKLRDAKKERVAARTARREAIQAVKPEADELLKEASERNAQREKLLYRRYVDSGMYWANYNDVARRRFSGAVQRVAAARKEGRPAQLRRSRRIGTGTLTVSLQRQQGMPQRTPAVISDDNKGKYRNVLHYPMIDKDAWDQMTRAARRRAGRVMVKMRIGQNEAGEPVWSNVPVQAHRMLPDEADIVEARLTMKRIGPDVKGQVVLMARVPDPAERVEGPRVALHLGWKNLDDEGVRVATWRSDGPITIPHRDVRIGVSLRTIMTSNPEGTSGFVIIPPYLDEELGKADSTRTWRDNRLNELKAELVTWIDENRPLPSPYEEEEAVTSTKIKMWRSPARFIMLGRTLDGDENWKAEKPANLIREWAKADRAAWRSQEWGRTRTLGHRNELFKLVAHAIASQARELVIDDTNLAQIARKPDPDKESAIPDQALEGVGRRRTLAAPGELRLKAVMAARREGLTVTEVSSKNLSLTHAACGTTNKPTEGDTQQCEGCGRKYDRDVSATVLMLQRALVASQANDLQVAENE